MPNGIKGFQKGHKFYPGGEKGWFSKGVSNPNKGKTKYDPNIKILCACGCGKERLKYVRHKERKYIRGHYLLIPKIKELTRQINLGRTSPLKGKPSPLKGRLLSEKEKLNRRLKSKRCKPTPEELRFRSAQWKKNNPEKVKQMSIEYYQKKKSIISEKSRKYRSSHREELKEMNRKNYLKNKESYSKKSKEYRITHRIKLNAQHLAKVKSDVEYAKKCLLRKRLIHALKIYSSTGKIMKSKDYGVDYNLIINHLKPFPQDIYKYHIDHIRPLCSFDLTNPEEVKKAFAPENHRWLLIKDNLKKSAEDRKLSLKINRLLIDRTNIDNKTAKEYTICLNLMR